MQRTGPSCALWKDQPVALHVPFGTLGKMQRTRPSCTLWKDQPVALQEGRALRSPAYSEVTHVLLCSLMEDGMQACSSAANLPRAVQRAQQAARAAAKAHRAHRRLSLALGLSWSRGRAALAAPSAMALRCVLCLRCLRTAA